MVPPDAGRGDYADLKRLVNAAGLFERQPRYCVARLIINVNLFAACLAVFLAAMSLWIIVPNSIALAAISGQLGFQLHDAGHHQMFRDRWRNVVVGFVTANLLLGMSAPLRSPVEQRPA